MQTKNTKKYIILAVLSVIAMLSGFSAAAQNSRLTMHKPARNLISKEQIGREVAFLADSLCQGRATGTKGAAEAGSWVARKFTAIGLKKIDGSWGQSLITENGTKGHNIIGFLPGSDKSHPDKYIVVGAHYDHLGHTDGRMYPGADANASGVVAMTSVADMLTMTRSIGRSYSCNIIFVAFDAKEMNMAGSQKLWEMIATGGMTDPVSGKKITKEKIAFMVNIDQIGSTLSPVNKDREDYLLMLGTHSLPASKRMNLEACNMLHNINLDLCLSYYGSKTFTDVFYKLSDQKVFVENRIPAVFFTSGITMNTNKTRDVVENLNISVLEKRIRLIYYWIESML